MRMMPGVVLSALLVVGCVHEKPKPQALPPTPPATADQIERLRSSYVQADPTAKVGVVTAVLPAENLAAVGDISVGDLNNGDVFTFLDANNQPLTVGKVIAKTADAVHVKYENPAATSREPIVGDLAVHVKLVPPQR